MGVGLLDGGDAVTFAGVAIRPGKPCALGVLHIIELTEGEHQARMRNVLAELEADNPHDAAHDIQEMLAGVLTDGYSGATMHLSLALSSARIGDAGGTAHHVSHFIEVADGPNRVSGEAVLALAVADKLVEAEHQLIELLVAIGVAVEEEGHADEGAHEEEEDGHVDEGTHEEAEGNA